uniref:ZP domain-containing protein n=1 Tax=Anopheles farauti TaxID=69004 RepID=A0A182Q3B8_9DIPT
MAAPATTTTSPGLMAVTVLFVLGSVFIGQLNAVYIPSPRSGARLFTSQSLAFRAGVDRIGPGAGSLQRCSVHVPVGRVGALKRQLGRSIPLAAEKRSPLSMVPHRMPSMVQRQPGIVAVDIEFPSTELKRSASKPVARIATLAEPEITGRVKAYRIGWPPMCLNFCTARHVFCALPKQHVPSHAEDVSPRNASAAGLRSGFVGAIASRCLGVGIRRRLNRTPGVTLAHAEPIASGQTLGLSPPFSRASGQDAEFAPHVTATCKSGTMNIKIQFAGPYNGVVHARDFRTPACMTFGNGSASLALSLNLLAKSGNSEYCGILVSNPAERCCTLAILLTAVLGSPKPQTTRDGFSGWEKGFGNLFLMINAQPSRNEAQLHGRHAMHTGPTPLHNWGRR